MKVAQTIGLGLVHVLFSSALLANPSSFCSNTEDGKPTIEEGLIRCQLQISEDDLAGTGIFDRLFSRVDIEIPIEFGLIDLLLAFGENVFSAPEIETTIVGTISDGTKIDISLTAAPLVYFTGESLCNMDIIDIDTNVTDLASQSFPFFVEQSLIRISNTNAVIKEKLTAVLNEQLPFIQFEEICPSEPF